LAGPGQCWSFLLGVSIFRHLSVVRVFPIVLTGIL
jgi:hypothetical protein